MQFWAAEVKAGEPLKVPAVEDSMLHISQAALGEVKKERGNESILLYATVDGKKIVLGTLSTEKCTQITYDLVFDKDFELSHSWKNGSVYFVGYQVEMPAEESDDDQFGSGDDSSEDDEAPPLVAAAANGKPELKVEKLKASADKAKVVKPETSDMLAAEGDSDEEDDDSSEEDEPTPEVKASKKRPAVESATKTPVPEKKAKLVTPKKSGGEGKKVNTHTATPHPSKQAGKSNADKSKQQSPKSGGSHTCKSCTKTFNSDGALQSHTKAKHQ
ncbi:hypothetical protein IFM89_015276 [Coptis chinensis]|uniref:C2H2-type domain-containing protein n=1 Tax=Coptis chinensis TaxID=261450 RepID=A0A835LJF9_9MAGN|nr:hypothetical protein IFM89_015276 [Coptis chinensis]